MKISVLQKELKANLTKAPTCRLIGIASGENHDGSLECIVPGKHVLWNGLGILMVSAFCFCVSSFIGNSNGSGTAQSGFVHGPTILCISKLD